MRREIVSEPFTVRTKFMISVLGIPAFRRRSVDVYKRQGDAMVGRVVNALGQPIDGAGPIDTKEFRPIESKAPGICERRSVYPVSYTHLDVYKRQKMY